MLEKGEKIIAIDNMNSYYDKTIKYDRLKRIKDVANKSEIKNFEFYECSIEDKLSLTKILDDKKIDIIVHLAAQAGVRYSIENPDAYLQSNLLGFGNILELARKFKVSNFIFASSSSVYGGNKTFPFKEDHLVDYPVSLYASTKKANEVMAHSYSHLYGIPSIGLRFFTVYGPFGRPDMAPIIFVKSIFEGKPLKIFNNGLMRRDFTYIDDIVEGVMRCCYKPATKQIKSKNVPTSAPYRIFNIGNGNPINLMDFINLLEDKIGLKAKKEFYPMQPGDVVETYACTKALKNWINYSPSTSIEEGIEELVEWYKSYSLNSKSTVS